MRTTDQSILGKVARLHYEHGLTHQEIAGLLGLSRVKVTRLLAEARRARIVEITVHSDEGLFVELENRLIERFGLKQAWVGPTFHDERAESSLGSLGAQAITSLVTPDVELVAVGFSRSVANALGQIGQIQRQGVGFVPVTGSPAGRFRSDSGARLTLGFAEALGGHSYHLPAPLLASNAQVASALMEETSVHEVMDRAARAQLLIAGMGAMGNDSRMLIDGLSQKELEQTRAAGAVGDLCARFFDAGGSQIPSPVDDRLIGLRLDQLVAIPTRLIIAHGQGKNTALRAALQGGLLNALVTDTATAEALLHVEDSDSRLASA